MTDLYFGLSVIYANKLLQSLLLYKNRYTTHLSSGEKNWGENKTSRMKDKGKRIHWVTNESEIYSHGPVLASPYFVQLISQRLVRNVSIFFEIHKIGMSKMFNTYFQSGCCSIKCFISGSNLGRFFGSPFPCKSDFPTHVLWTIDQNQNYSSWCIFNFLIFFQNDYMSFSL